MVDKTITELEEKNTGVDKKISQKDSVKSAEEELNNSMYFYHQIIEKLKTDDICYDCKKSLKEKEKENKNNINCILPVTTCDPGLVVFASLCNDCFQKLSKKEEE